jgi:putative membrane protein
MLEILRLLAGTVLLRPYVFIFFAAYLFLAITAMGWRRTLLFTVIAYLIALVCEYSSVHNGFPFGLYYYIPVTTDKELWIAGVPFMDSLSFTFLSYVSYEMAIFLRSPLNIGSRDLQVISLKKVRESWLTSLLAGLLMMYLDIVIDPVALQGQKWFLGKIYYYPNGGQYFGVTIANFIGWCFICVLILRVFIFAQQWIRSAARGWHIPFRGLGAAGLYFGVLGFNLTMTFLIGEKMMGWASTFIGLSLVMLFVNHLTFCARMNKSSQLETARIED